MIVKMLDISAQHITRDTKNWLDREIHIHGLDSILTVYDKPEYGWFIPLTDDEQLLEEVLEKCPYDLKVVIEYAVKQRANWIMFDVDSNAIDDLPYYDED